MARLRVVFALLVLGLLLPLGVLVHRALGSVAAERELRHRAVAERVFDEMERSLSQFLADEEQRPVAGWADARPRSPFVEGYFEQAPGEELVAPESLREPVARAFAPATPREPGRAARPAPGSTVPVAPGSPPERLEAEAARERSASPYAALQSLNRAVAERRQRQQPRARADADPSAEADAALAARRTEVDSVLASRSAGADSAVAQESAKADALLGAPADRPPAAPEEAVAASERADAPRRSRGAAPRPRPLADPLTGRPAGPERLVLSRTVWEAAGARRQGLVVSTPGLTAWLGRVLADARLPEARLDFARIDEALPDAAPDAYRYRHRLAEPFDALVAQLSLAPLGGFGGERALQALSLLVVLTAGAGLFAVYRMVATRLHFAERRSHFAAAVSHELKTPLTAIRMCGEMLRDGMVPSPERRDECYRTITAESERLTRLIQNVLEFSRLEKGTRPLELVAGDLGAVVRELAEWMGPHAESQGFRLRVEVEPDLPAVRFERDALHQVLFNLVDNSLKYSREAPLREIALRCRREGQAVVLSVVDRGPGIAPRQLERLFEPFQRGEGALVRRSQGSGLGLALVKGLAQRMGAALSGRNLEPGGFEVRLRFGAA